MKAVVLTAGPGTRLAPLTDLRPKPMLPIADRPLLEHVLDALAGAGVEEVVLVVGYKRQRIQDHFGDGDDWGLSIEYAHQDKQLGTGHAILQAESRVDGEFLALNGDRIIEPALVERVAGESSDGGTLMAVTRSNDPSDYGVVDLDGDSVASVTEKPPSHAVTSDVINAGVYRFGPGIFEEIAATETEGELDVTATINRLAARDAVRAVRYRGLWLDVSHLWDLPSVNAATLDRLGDQVADSARVDDRATVSGPVAVGADTRIRPGATVLRGTSLGPNVEVGANAVVSNAVVMPDATIGPGAVLRDCVVGENARVGPNTTVEGGRADVVVDDALHTDVRLGGVLGDNVEVGGSVTVDPGTVVGTGATVQSGTVLGGRVDAGAEVRRG